MEAKVTSKHIQKDIYIKYVGEYQSQEMQKDGFCLIQT